jgi:glycosyltransferase involved in cell wall biosynthesis
VSRFLLHDFLQVAGGAERMMLDLARAVPTHTLVVSRTYPEARPLMREGDPPVRNLGSWATRALGRIPEAIHCFQHATGFLRDAESVLYSGNYAPFAVKNQRGGKRVYYCHAPPRFAYELREYYLARMPAPARPAASAFFTYVRRHYEEALSRMDIVLANSENVRGRLRAMLGIEATVVHPPIDTERFRWLEAGDYFISLARLTPYKRVETIVRAFLQTPHHKLVVASGGPQEAYLRQLAAGAPNIRFTGWLSEADLAQWVGRARAAIYIPLNEDFGMSPVEAMAAGKPVIGVAEGGILETILPGETGVLVPAPPKVEAVQEAAEHLTAERVARMRHACEQRAGEFSHALFVKRMFHFLESSG